MKSNKSKWSWKSSGVPIDGANTIAWRFEVGLLDSFLTAEQNKTAENSRASDIDSDVRILVRLGELYSRLGQIDESLRVDQQLVALKPKEPTFYYNLACSYSRLEQIDQAVRALRQAVNLGYDKVDQILQDSDLDNLRGDGRFQRLVRKLQQPGTVD